MIKDTLPLTVDIHEHGSLSLVDFMGSDIDIVNAARTSFNSSEDIMDEKNIGLINYLMRERHGTPFEMVEFKFRVKAPLFVFREWHRHRVASINEWSGRYSKLDPEFYIPSADYFRKQVGNPLLVETARAQIESHCKTGYELYDSLLERGVAKEIARVHLPLNTYSVMMWKTNLRALLNFLSLRNSDQAMREIRDYAVHMETLAWMVCPHAMDAFEKHGRKCP
jgi:thymidylate synthase (FAD)